nr:reverse transcriptase domain-containing protein [Tanacetum cinerariifolium]
MTPIYEYLTAEILPEEKRKARAIHHKAGELHFEGDPRGVMQHACRSEIRGGKSFKIRVKKFMWDNIVCRFGLPSEIISDNGQQFRDNPFKYWCEKLWEKKESRKQSRKQKSKAKIKEYYNAKVRRTSFLLGDLVYWNNEASRAKDGGKLRPKWEGPYEVTKALGKGAY